MNPYISTRREFLQKGLGLLVAGATVPAFLEQTVWAMDDPLDAARTQRPSGKDGKILVVVQLSGGNDGLNTVIPFADDAYYRLRPTLGVDAKTVLKIDDALALNPQLAPMKKLFDDKQLAIVQGVGYPNPNRSHFRAMDIWHSGIPEKEIVTSGWLGRYFDNTCTGSDPHAGVSIGGSLPLAMQGQRITPLSFERPEAYRYNGPDRERYEALNQFEEDEKVRAADVAMSPGLSVSGSSNLDFLHRTAMDAQLSSDQIIKLTSRYKTKAAYPRGELGNGLRTVAAMIAGGLSTRVYYVSLGGFDTHANQRGRHDQLMGQLAAGVSAFWSDLKEQKNDGRVLMMTFSEFGRRVQQNASAGTDHGAAAPMFLIGSGMKEPIIGRHPSLTDLDRGDLKYNVDFRSVYAAVLQEWLETPSKPILGQQFAPAGVWKEG